MTDGAFDSSVRGIGGNWPPPPDYWSYFSLRHIRTCPRQWALARADYPRVWDGRGYPPRPGVSAIAGTVVHKCLEWILEAFESGDCAGPRDPKAPGILRSLGGFSNLIAWALEEAFVDIAKNPRMWAALPAMRTSLSRQTSDLRLRVQSLVAKVEMRPVTERNMEAGTKQGVGGLSVGPHAEVELWSAEPPLRGVADLVTVTENSCDIADYKSGKEQEDHDEQLRFYQLLWMLDTRQNPDHIPVRSLTVVYPHTVRSVPPLSREELSAYVAELTNEIFALRAEIVARPPRAIPSPENCGYCSVRHLCDEYWESGIAAELPAEGFGDALVRVLARRGDRSWLVVHVSTGIETLLHVAVESIALETHGMLRLLDAAFARSNPEEPPVITLTRFTECYVLS